MSNEHICNDTSVSNAQKWLLPNKDECQRASLMLLACWMIWIDRFFCKADIDSNFPHLGFWSLYPSLSVCGWHKLGFHFSANYEIAAVCGLYVALWHHIYFSANYEVAVVCASYVALWHQHKGAWCGVAGPGHVTTSIDLDLSFAPRSTDTQIRKFINTQIHNYTHS